MTGATKWILGGLALLALTSMGTNPLSNISSDLIDKIANAIAWAEGFFIAGSRPQRNHNPGDLTEDFYGKAIGQDGPFPVFANDADGWENLKHQVRLMFSGSHIYKATMTLAEIGNLYANGDPTWALNVSRELGVTPDTQLDQLT